LIGPLAGQIRITEESATVILACAGTRAQQPKQNDAQAEADGNNASNVAIKEEYTRKIRAESRTVEPYKSIIQHSDMHQQWHW